MAVPKETLYEYAGFRYVITEVEGRSVPKVTPAPGQHSAAGKEKHIRAAREAFLEDRARNP